MFRGFFGHTTLWTHSLFPHLGLVAIWWIIHRFGHRQYLETFIGLITVGGLSHLLLDVIAHSTPLFYPFSMYMVGSPSTRVLEGKLWGYLTDPVVLLEPLLLGLACGHWIVTNRRAAPHTKKAALAGLIGGLAFVSVAFFLLLPALRLAVGM